VEWRAPCSVKVTPGSSVHRRVWFSESDGRELSPYLNKMTSLNDCNDEHLRGNGRRGRIGRVCCRCWENAGWL